MTETAHLFEFETKEKLRLHPPKNLKLGRADIHCINQTRELSNYLLIILAEKTGKRCSHFV